MRDEKLHMLMDDTNNRPFNDIPRLSPEEEAEIDRRCQEIHHQYHPDSDISGAKAAVA